MLRRQRRRGPRASSPGELTSQKTHCSKRPRFERAAYGRRPSCAAPRAGFRHGDSDKSFLLFLPNYLCRSEARFLLPALFDDEILAGRRRERSNRLQQNLPTCRPDDPSNIPFFIQIRPFYFGMQRATESLQVQTIFSAPRTRLVHPHARASHAPPSAMLWLATPTRCLAARRKSP
jgi:hypothetical protein